jgi:uncharacterized protein YoxC
MIKLSSAGVIALAVCVPFAAVAIAIIILTIFLLKNKKKQLAVGSTPDERQRSHRSRIEEGDTTAKKNLNKKFAK